jgi:hypothetical protein
MDLQPPQLPFGLEPVLPVANRRPTIESKFRHTQLARLRNDNLKLYFFFLLVTMEAAMAKSIMTPITIRNLV